MISLPFGLFVLFSLADLGTLNQLTAIPAMTAVVIVLRTSTKQLNWNWVFLHGLVFVLLCAPLVNRLTDAPIELFNYDTFKIPLIIFIILYLSTLTAAIYFVCTDKTYIDESNYS
jgi:hypothetical protein